MREGIVTSESRRKKTFTEARFIGVREKSGHLLWRFDLPGSTVEIVTTNEQLDCSKEWMVLALSNEETDNVDLRVPVARSAMSILGDSGLPLVVVLTVNRKRSIGFCAVVVDYVGHFINMVELSGRVLPVEVELGKTGRPRSFRFLNLRLNDAQVTREDPPDEPGPATDEVV
ncbi:MAG: hypothetical protein P9L99_14870 [Candidatus Lernaella stagnicola]|nr:hypothetical protein [Candidatus Lernaella stagnicola]